MVAPIPSVPRGIAAELVERCGDDVRFLHHRRGQRPGKAVIPLVAIAASGIYVIGTPDHAAEIRSRRERGRTVEVLDLGEADPAAVLDDLGRQLAAVRSALAGHGFGRPVTAHSLLCLRPRTGSLVGSPTVAGVPLLTPLGTARVLTGPGHLDGAVRQAVYEHLDRHLPPGEHARTNRAQPMPHP
ncbi:MAG TPA: hypothetical protein VGO94_08480 [Mycobacteriales bacterium]|nr:hypothetical protein [Mycobacteriales bacterium]